MTRQETEPASLEDDDDFEVLHEEVERLPRKYREAVVLCYFEGLSLEAAAGQLRCPIGTLGVRLMRARERLEDRGSAAGECPSPAGFVVAGNARQVRLDGAAVRAGRLDRERCDATGDGRDRPARGRQSRDGRLEEHVRQEGRDDGCEYCSDACCSGFRRRTRITVRFPPQEPITG